MTPSVEYDAVVVGAGPNGLTAAISLARAGCSVLVVEAGDTPGGGMRTKELTLPGFRHDVCSAVHPLGIASPAFADLPLADHGLEWLHGEVEAANPFDDGSAGVLLRSLGDTDSANRSGGRWKRLMAGLVDGWPSLAAMLAPPVAMTSHPVMLTTFGMRATVPVTWLAKAVGPGAGALLAGSAAHANTSLRRPLSSTGGLVLAAAAHVGGWPVAKGGSQSIADALVAVLTSHGGKVECGWKVEKLDELPAARAYLFDTTPWQLIDILGDRLPERAANRWRRFRHGGASFKIDYALDGPMPWTNEESRRAITVHVGGSTAELAASEQAVFEGRVPERPFVLVGQQTLVDPSRAPAGKHTLWAYCHVPNGSTVDMTSRIEAQIDRFAPGWRDLVLGRHVHDPASLEAYNPNYIGGDIAGGAPDGLQVLFRPTISVDPYKTAADRVWLCSSSAPPGGGVHGMCGWWAARSVLKSI